MSELRGFADDDIVLPWTSTRDKKTRILEYRVKVKKDELLNPTLLLVSDESWQRSLGEFLISNNWLEYISEPARARREKEDEEYYQETLKRLAKWIAEDSDEDLAKGFI